MAEERAETYHCFGCGRQTLFRMDRRSDDPYAGLYEQHLEESPDCPGVEFVLCREGDVLVGYLNAFLPRQTYGGPEEGGWYYETGEPCAAMPLDCVYQRAQGGPPGQVELAPSLPEQAAVKSTGLRGMFGDDVRIRLERQMPVPYPRRRPRYE